METNYYSFYSISCCIVGYVFTRGGYVAQLPKMKFMVDDAIWAAENATLKAEMSGKKLMHPWNNLSSTLSFRLYTLSRNCLCTKDYYGNEIMSLCEALLMVVVVGYLNPDDQKKKKKKANINNHSKQSTWPSHIESKRLTPHSLHIGL
ncbi:hypothetical protein D8674_030243 [Pyrus ussuriensis x Pyrus communis]|uniref:Uncharacterized protein n=1 Tax=Pyrus ussuriensis x Pyrus communis TaxID=2448454 RepID=A0A5N5EW86_9ROSA|nr:hypothetical protein D8674_030243 [Pyrus ussuriensis x Pyrus communis]